MQTAIRRKILTRPKLKLKLKKLNNGVGTIYNKSLRAVKKKPLLSLGGALLITALSGAAIWLSLKK